MIVSTFGGVIPPTLGHGTLTLHSIPIGLLTNFTPTGIYFHFKFLKILIRKILPIFFSFLSLESLQKVEEAKRKKEKLEERRKKMSTLVKNEEETYKKELEKLSKRETVFFEDLNVANMEFC